MNAVKDNGFVFFHNPDEKNGFLSNWFMSDFKVANITFTSAEQYMMYKKAELFGDVETADRILQTSNVRDIKALGRQVARYVDSIWAAKRYQIMVDGLYEKFHQSDELTEALLATEDCTLAECAVRDTIWGIGLSMQNNNRYNQSNWRGTNLLGKALMEVRSKLKE